MSMVVKIGGSFQGSPSTLRKVCETLEEISKKQRLLIIPGGGKFADLVRDVQAKYGLSDKTSHEMALLGMDVFGHMLGELVPGFARTDDLSEGQEGSSVLLPHKVVENRGEIEPSWKVTSDAIAAWACAKANFEKLVLVKRVDGIHDQGKFQERITTSKLKGMDQDVVDRKLPKFLKEYGLNCWLVNGEYPDRIKSVADGESTVCTTISPGADG